KLWVALAKEAEEAAAVIACELGFGRRARAREEAALRLAVQRNDELRAIVGLAVQRVIRDDDRGSRQCRRPDAIDHFLRDGDAVERVLGVARAVDSDRGPAQARVGARHCRDHMRADRLAWVAYGDRKLDRIKQLAGIRQPLTRVAPNINLLRRAADEHRDRREREPGLALCFGSVEQLAQLRGPPGCLRLLVLGAGLGLICLGGGEAFLGGPELSLGPRSRLFQLAQQLRLALRSRFPLRLLGHLGGLVRLAGERFGARPRSRERLR